MGQRKADNWGKKQTKKASGNRPKLPRMFLFVLAKKLLNFPVSLREGGGCLRRNRVLLGEKINTVPVIQRASPTLIPSPKSSDHCLRQVFNTLPSCLLFWSSGGCRILIRTWCCRGEALVVWQVYRFRFNPPKLSAASLATLFLTEVT